MASDLYLSNHLPMNAKTVDIILAETKKIEEFFACQQSDDWHLVYDIFIRCPLAGFNFQLRNYGVLFALLGFYSNYQVKLIPVFQMLLFICSEVQRSSNFFQLHLHFMLVLCYKKHICIKSLPILESGWGKQRLNKYCAIQKR